MSMMPPGMGMPGMPGGMPGAGMPGAPGGLPGMPPGMGADTSAPMGMNPDGTFDLSLGEDVVPVSDFEPIPAGTYNLYASKVEVTPTRAGEAMITIHWALDGAQYGNFEGRIVKDNQILPGPHRREEFAKDGRTKWVVMMSSLREWLERITGRPWREDNMKLNPQRDLTSLTVQALVGQEVWNNTETSKSGVRNVISRYLQAGGQRAASPFGMPGVPGAPAVPAGVVPPGAVPGMVAPQQPAFQPQVPQQPVQPQPQPQTFPPAEQAQPQIDPTEPPAPMPQPAQEQVPTPPPLPPIPAAEDNPTITPQAPVIGEPPSRFDV